MKYDFLGRGVSRELLRLIVLVTGILAMTACAYQPSSHVIRNLFAENVYVEVHVDRAEPENAPFVKDEMNKIVYNRFKGHIVPKDQAQSQIYITYAGSYFAPLSYKDGYVTRYRTYVNVRFDMLTKDGKISKNIRTIYEADIENSALTSNALRIEAIKKGLAKAMDEFLAYASARSAQMKKEKEHSGSAK